MFGFYFCPVSFRFTYPPPPMPPSPNLYFLGVSSHLGLWEIVAGSQFSRRVVRGESGVSFLLWSLWGQSAWLGRWQMSQPAVAPAGCSRTPALVHFLLLWVRVARPLVSHGRGEMCPKSRGAGPRLRAGSEPSDFLSLFCSVNLCRSLLRRPATGTESGDDRQGPWEGPRRPDHLHPAANTTGGLGQAFL